MSVLVADLESLVAYGAHLRPPPNDTLTGHAFLWAIGMNTVGTLLVVGSSLASILRRRRITGNVLLLAGVAALAGSGTLTRFGDEGLVIAGQAVGIVLLAAGFELAEQRPARAGRGCAGSASAGPASIGRPADAHREGRAALDVGHETAAELVRTGRPRPTPGTSARPTAPAAPP